MLSEAANSKCEEISLSPEWDLSVVLAPSNVLQLALKFHYFTPKYVWLVNCQATFDSSISSIGGLQLEDCNELDFVVKNSQKVNDNVLCYCS